jgi:hypothetical protein
MACSAADSRSTAELHRANYGAGIAAVSGALVK